MLCLSWVEVCHRERCAAEHRGSRRVDVNKQLFVRLFAFISAESVQSTADPACLPSRPVYKDVTDVCVCLSLTFAGVWVCVRPLGVPVEAGPAPLALAALCVVHAVAHATAALAGLAPRRPIKVAALSMTVTLAL